MEIQSDNTKNILVISYGPVPTPEFQKIEGGGMRCWGLATGLRDNGHAVTVSVFEEFKQTISSHEGIGLHNWALNDAFKDYINSFDVIVVSYSMGDLSVFVADNLSHHITLVLDCYVPIFMEISARDSDDKSTELRGYLYEVNRFNHVLDRGDFFLCANEPQKHLYSGILGSLGVINPYTYRQHRLLLVPFGIDDNFSQTVKAATNPYTDTSSKDFVLLWFGGLYPWFDFEPLISAVKEMAKNPHFKFYLVGGKNPYNNHPDFVRQYNHVADTFEKLNLVGKSVFLVDWVDFDDRARWYRYADAVVSINKPGEENIYSWRTRVMDYLWGELPMLSNGGDPLSDELILEEAAIKISLSSDEIFKLLSGLMTDTSLLATARRNLARIKRRYFWQTVTKSLSDLLKSGDCLPYLDCLVFMEEHQIERINPGLKKTPLREGQQLVQVAKKARSYAMKARQKGLRRSAKFGLDMLKTQLKSSPGIEAGKPKAFFISHPIDHTGAPLVLLDVIDDFSKMYPQGLTHIVAPAIERDLLNRLLSQKYKIHKMADGIGGRLIQAGLKIRPDDFVLMNSIAVYQNYRDFMYWMLESSHLKTAYWFIHEDNPSTKFGNSRENRRIERLTANGRLKLLTPSHQTAQEYNRFFKTNTVKSIKLRVEVPKEYQDERNQEDFAKIKFFISGNPLDGRKGQLLFLSALQLFEGKYKTKMPSAYRPYSLDLVAIGNDYVSEQIRCVGKAVLGNEFHVHPVVPRKSALDIASKCNVTVCCSLMETFGLFVAEGMLMGHSILRNKSSGWQEQIRDGENGFIFDSLSLDELAQAIGKILDKQLPNESLMKMSRVSQTIASGFSHANYYQQISKL